MEYLMQGLTETSNAIETEVLAKYYQCKSDLEVQQWLGKELSQLATTKLVAGSPISQAAWLKRVFANLRLHYAAQVGEAKLVTPKGTISSKEAELEVLDILVERTDWERLCALGSGTYEQFIYRLRALALMGSTVTTSCDEYVTRFCTEYKKFGVPTAAEPHWLPLLRSLQTALKTSPIVAKTVQKFDLRMTDQVIAVPKELARRSASPVSRERIVSFSAVLGLLIVCGAVLWGGPSWKQNGPSKEPAIVAPSARPVALSTPQPTQPTPIRKAVPPPAATTPEEAGFYVIGMAARQEESAQAEAQQRRQEGLQPRVVYSSNWSGLTPNYFQVVYGIFANRADTAALRKELEKRGIKTYVMHSGQRVR